MVGCMTISEDTTSKSFVAQAILILKTYMSKTKYQHKLGV